MKATVCCVAMFICLSGGAQTATALNLVANGGFESDETTFGGPSFPSVIGDWHGDVSDIVTSQDGITPFGSQMLHFINTLKTGPDGANTASNLWQIIDVTGNSSEIAAGTAVVSSSAEFNRVLGDVQTDTEFYIEVSAYQGLPSSFPSQSNNSELATIKASIVTDGDVNTWETAMGNLLLPTNTDFIAVEIAAVENVFNDAVNPEFDGHYADDVMVNIVPEPSTLTLAALSLLGLLGCGRRRRQRTA